MTKLLRKWIFAVVGVLAIAPGVYAQTIDASGRSSAPTTIAPALPTNPDVDLVFTPLTPCRLCDTRGLGDAGSCTLGIVSSGSPRDVQAAGKCGVPAGANAVSINITAVPAGPGVGDLRVAPNPPGALPLASVVNYQNFETVANAADVPIGPGAGAGVRLFVDGEATDVVVDVMGYYNDVACQAGTVKALGQCYETGLRAASSVFQASDACKSAGGRLATGAELRSLRGGSPLVLAAAPGEWVDSVYVDDGNFRAMTISNSGGFDDQATIPAGGRVFRCVFRPQP